MGLYSRDYAREHGPSPGGFGGGAATGTVCKRLIVVTVAVFLLQLLFVQRAPAPDGSGAVPAFGGRSVSVVENWLALMPDRVLDGQVWRLVTYAFCHARQGRYALLHIVFNMLLLWWFGRTLEAMFGSREFLLMYLAAAVASGLVYVLIAYAVGNMGTAIGASGAIMAIMMIYAMYFPRQQVYLFGIFPIEIRWLIAAFIAFDLLPVLKELSGAPVSDGVAHSAHLGGLAFGFLYKKFGLKLAPLLDRLRRPGFGRLTRSRRQFRIYDPSTSEDVRGNLDEQVDAILEKISRSGEDSLTERERHILKEAAQRYKQR